MPFSTKDLLSDPSASFLQAPFVQLQLLLSRQAEQPNLQSKGQNLGGKTWVLANVLGENLAFLWGTDLGSEGNLEGGMITVTTASKILRSAYHRTGDIELQQQTGRT